MSEKCIMLKKNMIFPSAEFFYIIHKANDSVLYTSLDLNIETRQALNFLSEIPLQ